MTDSVSFTYAVKRQVFTNVIWNEMFLNEISLIEILKD
jgi:hypothetical protein